MSLDDYPVLRRWLEDVAIPEILRPPSDEEIEAALAVEVTETPEAVQRRKRMLDQLIGDIAEREGWTRMPAKPVAKQSAQEAQLVMAASGEGGQPGTIHRFTVVDGDDEYQVSLFPNELNPAWRCVQIEPIPEARDIIVLVDGEPISQVEPFGPSGVASVEAEAVAPVEAEEAGFEIAFRPPVG